MLKGAVYRPASHRCGCEWRFPPTLGFRVLTGQVKGNSVWMLHFVGRWQELWWPASVLKVEWVSVCGLRPVGPRGACGRVVALLSRSSPRQRLRLRERSSLRAAPALHRRWGLLVVLVDAGFLPPRGFSCGLIVLMWSLWFFFPLWPSRPGLVPDSFSLPPFPLSSPRYTLSLAGSSPPQPGLSPLHGPSLLLLCARVSFLMALQRSWPHSWLAGCWLKREKWARGGSHRSVTSLDTWDRSLSLHLPQHNPHQEPTHTPHALESAHFNYIIFFLSNIHTTCKKATRPVKSVLNFNPISHPASHLYLVPEIHVCQLPPNHRHYYSNQLTC